MGLRGSIARGGLQGQGSGRLPLGIHWPKKRRPADIYFFYDNTIIKKINLNLKIISASCKALSIIAARYIGGKGPAHSLRVANPAGVQPGGSSSRCRKETKSASAPENCTKKSPMPLTCLLHGFRLVQAKKSAERVMGYRYCPSRQRGRMPAVFFKNSAGASAVRCALGSWASWGRLQWES